MKHTAILCGIGAIGKNTLLLNPKYVNELTKGAILTDLDLKSNDLCENICIEGYHKCIENCTVGAIQDGSIVQKLCRNNAYGKIKRGFDTVECNVCRTVFPMRYGINKWYCKSTSNGVLFYVYNIIKLKMYVIYTLKVQQNYVVVLYQIYVNINVLEILVQ